MAQIEHQNQESTSLDDVTLYRFAHMYRNTSSGGVESYLGNLNRLLLERNRMRILQTYLSSENNRNGVEVEKVGRGEIVWIPSIEKYKKQNKETRAQKIWAKIKSRFTSENLICHDFLLSTLDTFKVELAVFHWLSEDSKFVIDYFNNKCTPLLVVNHFNNSRFRRRLIKRQVAKVSAIAGVSNVDVPSYIKSRFTNLSDGIDTDYFKSAKADLKKIEINGNLIFFPSRITEGKGHLDAVKALSYMSRDRVKATLAFAGRIESPELLNKLKRAISIEGLQDNVIFLNKLELIEMRNWYAAADVTMLASYTEGLPRVLLEAQAMEKPVVAYEVGGVSEAVKNHETGLLAKKGDAKELAKHLKVLLENNKKRLEMGYNAKKHVTLRFSMSELVLRHEEFYRQTLGTRKRPE